MEGAPGLALSRGTSSPAVSSGGRPRDRCQRENCLDMKARYDESVTEIRRLQNRWDEAVATNWRVVNEGEARRLVESPMHELQMEIDQWKRFHAKTCEDNSRFLRRAHELGAERLLFLNEIAQLKSDLKGLHDTVAAAARREALDERARGREKRKLVAAVVAADEHAEVEAARAEERVALAEERAALAGREASAASTSADDAEKRAALAEERADDAEERAALAGREASAARQDAINEGKDAATATEMAEYQAKLSARQVARAKSTSVKLAARLKELEPLADGRSSDEWSGLRQEARWKAGQRERASIRSFLASHPWRLDDIADVMDELGWMRPLINKTKAGWRNFFALVKPLHAKLQDDDYGVRFGLFLHFEMKLSLAKLQQIVDGGCKEYHKAIDRCKKKCWLANPYNPKEKLMTPRIVPARTKLEPIIKEITKSIGIESSENGKLAFIPMASVIQNILVRDAGRRLMPSLGEFYTGMVPLKVVISRDATGKGNLQFTTCAARSPWMTKSAQQLHIFGFGLCGDDRSGSSRLFGPNLSAINTIIKDAAEDRCTPCLCPDGETRDILVDPYFTDDVSALRHGEHLACSGWCGCTRFAALRQVPIDLKPTTVSEMRKLVSGDGRCRELSCLEREILSHNPVEGESIPRPCIAKGCTFAHNPSKAAKEYADMLAKEAELAADTSKKGRTKFTQCRMQHAWKGPVNHLNVQPGLYGKPMLRHHMRKQILDGLHLAQLGAPKTSWKHGIKNNASDDAREEMSMQLKAWKHGLDMRRKDDGMCREQKWFTGEKWASFCAGKDGSPGGPIAIATLVMIIADDLTLRGVDHGAGERVETTVATTAGGRGSGRGARGGAAMGRGRGRASFAAKQAVRSVAAVAMDPALPPDPTLLQAERARLQHKPTAVELAANQKSLAVLRKMYGSRAQTIINILISFDAFFAWYYPFMKSVPYLCDIPSREQRALDNCRKAIDMQEAFERISHHNHGSYLPHGAVFKVTRDILEVGEVRAHDLSALELQNAESKRVYETGGARRQEFTTEGTTHKKATGDGEHRLIVTKGYGSTAATSVLS